MVENTKDGFAYSINARGKQVNKGLQSPYARAYVIGAKIVNSRFSAYSDEEILEYISDLSTKAKEG